MLDLVVSSINRQCRSIPRETLENIYLIIKFHADIIRQKENKKNIM